MQACALGDFDRVRRLIAAGAAVNSINGGGWTPLTYACYVGHDVIVNYLLDECGVDVNMGCADGGTALLWASACGNESIVYFLLQVRASGETFSFRAARE